MRLMLLGFVVVALVSCKKAKQDEPIRDGNYVGTFQRQYPGGGGAIANVNISFADGKWSGNGEVPKYPGLCSGSYSFNGTNTIYFENECPWSADFDWTLILGREYQFVTNGDEVEITKDYNGAYKDIYRIKRQ